MARRELPNERVVESFIHCAECLRTKPANISPREWAQLEVGFTREGLQVWCRRHDRNVLHIDFEGARHPARMD